MLDAHYCTVKLTGLTPSHCYARPKPGPEFALADIIVFFILNNLR